MSFPIPPRDRIAIAVSKMETYTGDIQDARLKIMEYAKEIGAEDLIPDNWNEDGTIKGKTE